MKSRRKLSNVQLTREFHFKHMGIWVAVGLFLVAVANLLWVLTILVSPTATLTPAITFALALEMLFAAAFVIWLAKFTSHRIAGPLIGLRDVCQRLAAGELDARVQFRTEDGLDDLQTAFNTMADTLAASRGAGPAATEDSIGDPSSPAPSTEPRPRAVPT